MNKTWNRLHVYGLLLTPLVWASVLLYWANSQDRFSLRNTLGKFNPSMVGLTFLVLCLATSYFAIPVLKRLLRPCPRWAWIGALAASLLGFSLVHFAAPQTHHVYFDEDIYQAIGLNLAYGGSSSIPNDGQWRFGRFQVMQNEYYKQPSPWPFLLSLMFRIAGPGEAQAFLLTHIVFAMTILLIFLAAWLLTEEPGAALFAALFYALIPENVRWFSTTAIEPSTICFTILAFCSVLLFLRQRTVGVLIVVVSSLAFAVQFRVESSLFLILIGIVLVMQARDEFRKPVVWWFVMAFLVLLSGHFMHIYAMWKEPWGSNGTRFAASFVSHNISTNSHYFFQNSRFPVAVSILTLLGLIISRRKHIRLWLGIWFFISWLPFIFFYAGSYNYGADVRFSLLAFPPMAILAGEALDRLRHVIKGPSSTRTGFWVCGTFLLLLLLGYLPTMHAVGEEAWEARDDHQAAMEFAALVPDDGLVLTHDPSLFQIRGLSAAQMFLARNSNYIEQVLRPRYHDRLYVHWNYWCNTNDRVQVSYAEYLLNRYSCKLLAEKIIRGKRYALYQLGEMRPTNETSVVPKPAWPRVPGGTTR